MNPAVDRDEPGKLASGVLAVAVHVAFLALLVFGAAWQQQPPEVVMVDLWNNLPPVPAVKSPPPAPPPPKPEAKPAPPPVAKPEPKVVPPKPAPKPDIAIEKEKQEKARREREEKEKAELKKREDAQAEQRKREEREKAEVAKREAIEKQKQIEQQKLAAKEAERARLEKEQNDAAQRLQQMQAAAQSKEFDGFRTKVQDKIKRFVVKAPCAALADPEIVLEMKFFPDGNMIGEPVVRKSSGSPACDDAVRRAAILAQPLPLPPPGHPMLSQFMNLNLRFKPND